MSWLRNHIRCFVVPGLKALAKARGPLYKPALWSSWLDYSPKEEASILASDVRPLNISLRPSKKCKYTEAGLVYSAVCSFFRDVPGPSTPGGSINRNSFREQALEILRECDAQHFLPNRSGIVPAGSNYKAEDVIHSILKSSWRSLKEITQGKTIILPGRDVWPWEVLARRNNYPTIYDPRISRILCSHKEVLRKICKEWDVDFGEVIIFDTGFAGSIPAAISDVVGTKVRFLMLSSNRRDGWTQLFPNHRGSRSKVLCIEYFPKYFKTGTVDNGQPVQYLSYPLDFVKTAAFTIWLWYHRSPRFIKQHITPSAIDSSTTSKATSLEKNTMPG
jgi:hypothetical protein